MAPSGMNRPETRSVTLCLVSNLKSTAAFVGCLGDGFRIAGDATLEIGTDIIVRCRFLAAAILFRAADCSIADTLARGGSGGWPSKRSMTKAPRGTGDVVVPFAVIFRIEA